MESLNISINKKIEYLLGKKNVCIKDNIFYLSQFNYFTFMKILKMNNLTIYKKFHGNELYKLAINKIINDNTIKNEEDITNLYNFIINLDFKNLEILGKNIRMNTQNIILSKNFIKEDFKALIYTDKNLDYKFIFKELPDLKVIFVYNEILHKTLVIDKNEYILTSYNNKILNEIEINNLFKNFNENELEEEKKIYINNIIKDFLNNYLDMDLFFNDFIEEILNRFFNILNISEVDEQNFKIIEKNKDKFKINLNILNFIEKKDKSISI